MTGYVVKFLESYDAPTKDAIWRQHSTRFRKFWSERILSPSMGPIPDADCDAMIQILDRQGKGNTKESQAVALTRVPQGAWRKIINSIHADKDLSTVMDSIFKEDEPTRRAALIDKFYHLNEGKKNRMAGKMGIVINALVAAYDPFNNLSVVSLNDRKAQLDFLGIALRFDWDSATVGQKIAQSNLLLLEGTRSLGIEGSARTISYFWYFGLEKALWRREHTVKRTDKDVTVTVPMNSEADDTDEQKPEDKDEIRESLRVQAILAEVGTKMGFKIWLPKSDRARILTKWTPEPGELLDELPLNYDLTTLKTIEQIDVIWLRRRAIVRAFEIEHTTSVYSGLLRMADLIALQPNMDIKLHIVAPATKRGKVFQEIRRPVFSLLEGKALSEICTFLSYDAVNDIRAQKLLEHLSDEALEEYEEHAEDPD